MWLFCGAPVARKPNQVAGLMLEAPDLASESERCALGRRVGAALVPLPLVLVGLSALYVLPLKQP